MVTDRPGRRTWRKIFLEKWWQRRRTHIVLLVWAAIYLPGLGSLEIKGEEGRRILPAVTMLQTGNYLVPYVGSEPYFRKPPLVNWIEPLRSSSQDFARNGRHGFLRRWRFSPLRSRLSRVGDVRSALPDRFSPR